jgi:hypothetical protein
VVRRRPSGRSWPHPPHFHKPPAGPSCCRCCQLQAAAAARVPLLLAAHAH